MPLAALGLVACGSSGQRQDVSEPSGKFPVQIVTSDFPNRQLLAQTSDLRLGIKNIGDKTIPDLTITISTDPSADASFSVRSKQPGLAEPSHPVWLLEFGYPKYAGQTAPAGAAAAQTKSFAFGALDPGTTKQMIWKLTPVIAGTYTVGYKVAAGLQGKAIAVTGDGSAPAGEFVVQISSTPTQTRVNDQGQVVPITPSNIIGQAGTPKQRSEVQGQGK